MKTIAAVLLFLFAVLAALGQAPPYQRQFFTTNLDPVVQATAGSNVFITYTLVGQTRTYRIDVPVTGTNVVTNLFITTNIFYINSNFFGTNIFLIATNTTYGQNIGLEQDGTTGGVYSVTIGNTNYFKMLVGGPAYGIAIYTNNDYLILSNLYPNIYWFTNALGPSNSGQNLYQYTAAGSISNNYNVSIRGLLQLYGQESNTLAGSTTPFTEFWVGGPNWSNTFMGRYAGVNSSNGLNGSGGNVFIGYRAGYSNTIGYGCVLIGSHAGQHQRTSPGNICIGEGVMTGYPVTENGGNTIIGWRAAGPLVNGFGGNTIIGKYAAIAMTQGGDNVGVGVGSLGVITGDGNVAVGANAMQSSGPANYNTAIGNLAAPGTLGRDNIVVGRASGANMAGQSNIVLGGSALIQLSATHPSSNNIIIGPFTGQGMYTGSCNLLIGDSIGMMNYGVPAGYTLHSNIIIGVNHTPKMRWDPVDKWKFEDSLGVRYNLYPTQSVNIGYPSIALWTNYYGTNTLENATPPATNIQFRLLVPSNLVIIATNGAGFTSNTTVYGTTGDALVNVPFRSASSSTSAPAGDEFATVNYVLAHSGGGGTNFIYQNYGFVYPNDTQRVAFSNTFSVTRDDQQSGITLNTNGSVQITNPFPNVVPLRIDQYTTAQTTNVVEIARNGVMSFVVRSNGFVGINTNAPQYSLSVLGNGSFSSTLRVNEDVNGYVLLDSSGMNISRANARITGGGNGLKLNVYDGFNDTNAITIASPSRLVSIGASATIAGPFTSTSSTTNGPSATEFPVAGWVRSLLSGSGAFYHASTNVDSGTNTDSPGQLLYQFRDLPQPYSARGYTNIPVNSYMGSVVTTNTFSVFSGPVTVNAWMTLINGSGGRSISVRPEIYYSFNKTNWLGDWEAASQSISTGTNLYSWVIGVPTTVAPTTSVVYVERRFRVTATNGASQEILFHIGTNGTTINDTHGSHMTFTGPSSSTLPNNITYFDPNGVLTNVLMNGSYQSNTCGTATFDFSKPRQFTNTTTDITFSAVTGQAAVDVRTVALTITNSSGSAKLLTIPGTWNSPTNVYTVTNVSILSVESWGTYMTNAVCRGIK